MTKTFCGCTRPAGGLSFLRGRAGLAGADARKGWAHVRASHLSERRRVRTPRARPDTALRRTRPSASRLRPRTVSHPGHARNAPSAEEVEGESTLENTDRIRRLRLLRRRAQRPAARLTARVAGRAGRD